MTTTEYCKLALKQLKANDSNVRLVGRESEIRELESFLIDQLTIRKTGEEKRRRTEAGLAVSIPDRHRNRTTFICGVPGTGKTAVVLSVLDKLSSSLKTKGCQLHKFKYIYVNAQHLSEPRKIYSEIYSQLTNTRLPHDRAQDELNKLFAPSSSSDGMGSRVSNTNRRSKRKPTETKSLKSKDLQYIVVIDEMDLLYSEKSQQVFYSLFDWPTTSESRLILVTIANAMDLPERFMRGRVGSRLGWNKIVFEPYKKDNLVDVLKSHLGNDLFNKCFKASAIQLLTLRIAKTTGDARRIIDDCCMALEEAIKRNEKEISIELVGKVVVNRNQDSAQANYIRSCSPLELIILKGILDESTSKGEENIYARGVYYHVANKLIQAKHHWLREKVIDHDEFHELLNFLQGLGLICMEGAAKNLFDKRLFIKDKSETARDVIRQTTLEKLGY